MKRSTYLREGQKAGTGIAPIDTATSSARQGGPNWSQRRARSTPRHMSGDVVCAPKRADLVSTERTRARQGSESGVDLTTDEQVNGL